MWWTVVFLVFYSAQVAWSLNVKKKLDEHPMPRSLSESKLSDLAQRTDYQRFTEDILKNIMRVRVPGTVGHHKVKLFIKDQFKRLNWTVTVDEFDSDTPLGFKRFTNIIATLNPNARKRLVLAAHYDSKLYDQKNDQKEYFLGATDSAVPCAMLIEIARVVTPLFKAAERNHANRDAWPESDEGDVTLQMIFFDGEEAFVEWTKNDSLYGARHLAELWEKTPHPSGINDTNLLSSITAFVLLDLIGSSTPVFYNMFRETNDLFERLQFIERRLMTTNQIINHADTYFMTGLMDRRYFVEDDHIPFLERNVKILHLIPLPFPPCWHKYCDDSRALDHNVIHDLLKILQVFVVEYFGLRISE